MSRRFGRNQRRRAREALAAASSEAERFKTAHEMTSGLLSHVAASKRELEQQIEEAKRMVGPYSALFSPETTESQQKADPWVRLRVAPLTDCEDSIFDLGSMGARETMTFIDLPAMLASVHKDTLTDKVHVLVQYEGDQWAYHIDRRTLHAMGKARAVKEMSKYLALAIGADLFNPSRVAA